jgi:gamma-glutamyl:cysteine ligase YbdK (ATP-grasp superfamily)
MWLATRDGIGGHLVDLDTGARVWTADRLQDLASQLMPTATSLGCDRELLGIGRLVLDGGGAARQRGIVQRRGLESLLPALAEETSSQTAEEAEARLLGAVHASGNGGIWG